LIPHRLAPEGLLWRETLRTTDVEQRLAVVHRPYHQAIENLLAAARLRWGAAAFIDLHSMPTPADPVDVAIGDRFGLTASGGLVDQLLALTEGHGFSAARNHPYAGAFGIERHMHRGSGSEALQLEIARHLYLHADGRPDGSGLARVGSLIQAIAEATEASLLAGQETLAIAAE
jgi:N-formylglutamate amidohydrolase